ncbi:MAG: hypothetical protein ACOYMB_04685 [Patescibacteria group bacterium]
MKTIKIICAWLKKWRNYLMPIIFSLALIIMFVYSVASNLWLKYPLFLKTPLAFEKLSLSAFQNPLCHEDCALDRLLARGVLVESLKNNNQRTMKKIIKSLNDQNEDLAFKFELLKAWREAFGSDNLAVEMLAVFQNSQDEELRTFFQKNFNLPLSTWRGEERQKALNQELSFEKRAASLVLLGSKDPEFSTWATENNLLANRELLAPFLQSLLSSPNYLPITPDFYENLWNELISSNEQTRNLAIFLARATCGRPGEISENFLKRVYYSDEFSIFSRSFAAEILNRQKGRNDFLLPEIKEQDWEKYLAGGNL